MIYIAFTYGYILFCSMKEKKGTKHLEFVLVVLSVVFPTAIPHSREKSKGWTSGGVTECERH